MNLISFVWTHMKSVELLSGWHYKWWSSIFLRHGSTILAGPRAPVTIGASRGCPRCWLESPGHRSDDGLIEGPRHGPGLGPDQ